MGIGLPFAGFSERASSRGSGGLPEIDASTGLTGSFSADGIEALLTF